MIKALWLWAMLLLTMSTQVRAQDSLTLMFYNLLNFPDAVPNGRWDTLQNIMQYKEVDLLMVCELKNLNGANFVLNEALNEVGVTHWQSAGYEPMQSNPFSSGKLQQLVYYNNTKLKLQSKEIIITEVRDINKYTLYLNDPNLFLHQDTTFVDVYVTHLKASEGSANEENRRRAVDSLLKHLDEQSFFRNTIIAGDLNLYSSSEPAYQSLINPANNIFIRDPIDTPGDWHTNSAFRNTHTQSSRTSPIFGDGAGGGVDDRFDFILLSNNMINGSSRITYVDGTYQALGNNGNCFNENITSCESNPVPQGILSSLYHMSDHLPVILDLAVEYPQVSGISGTDETGLSITFSNAIGDRLNLRITAPTESEVHLLVYDQFGRLICTRRLQAGPVASQHRISSADWGSGLHILRLESTDQKQGISAKFVKY